MESERLRKIREENVRWEKGSPYNFCDRWCERCPHERQTRCSLYLDELERKVTCIAHGREPDDPDMTAEVMKKQYESIGEALEEFTEEQGIDLDDNDIPEMQKIKEHIEFVHNNPLEKTARQYSHKAHEFLKETFFTDQMVAPELVYDFETVAWYHTLLPVKLHRGLCGFHEPMTDGDISLCDAVAQFVICKDAIRKSIEALRKIKPHYPRQNELLTQLIAILHNILSRITEMKDRIL